MRRDNLSAQPADRADRSGFVRAERAFITLTLNTLRATPRTRCFFCGGLLEGGLCERCDRE